MKIIVMMIMVMMNMVIMGMMMMMCSPCNLDRLAARTASARERARRR